MILRSKVSETKKINENEGDLGRKRKEKGLVREKELHKGVIL